MNRIARLIRHRLWDEADAHRALPADALARLKDQVARSETRHSGEIRICVEAGLPLRYLWRRATARERALALFGKLHVWDTEHNNGVLIYLLLAEQRVEIVADRALAQRITRDEWQRLVDSMAAAFRESRFEQGLGEAVAGVDELLFEYFPLPAGAPRDNELPDAPLIL